MLDTRKVIEQFDQAFHIHDPAGLSEIIADNCVLENTGPAPDGATYEGHDACLAFWSSIASNADMNFETESIDVLDDRAIIKWRLRWGEKDDESVRGVNIMKVKEGKIIEALGYVKS